MDKEFHGHYDIWGGDIDPRAVAIARDNARKAGVEDMIRFEVADMRDFRRDSTYGQLVTNPPYGERLMEKREAEDAGAQQPYGVRTLLRTARRQEAQALQRHDQVRPVHVRQCVRASSRSHGLPHKFSICSFNFLP